MRNRDEIKGKVEHVKGRMKEHAGDLRGDERLRGEGEVEKLSGNARETPGKERRKTVDALDDSGDKLER